MVGEQSGGDRVLVGDALTEHTALPVAEEHLAQVGLDTGLDAQPLEQRGSGLAGALQGRDVHRGDPLAGRDQPVRDAFGLNEAVGVVQGRVGVPVDEGERVAVDERRRLAVADEQDLAGARRGANRCCRNWRGVLMSGKLPGARTRRRTSVTRSGRVDRPRRRFVPATVEHDVAKWEPTYRTVTPERSADRDRRVDRDLVGDVEQCSQIGFDRAVPSGEHAAVAERPRGE